MMPGVPEDRTHDYRHGITSLFAALNIVDGTVISQQLPARTRPRRQSAWPAPVDRQTLRDP